MSPAAADGGGTSSSSPAALGRRVDLGDRLGGDDRVLGRGRLGGGALAAARPAARRLRLLAGRLLLGLAGERGLLGEQRLAVGLRDLVVVGMDFREGEEPVPVAAVVDEGRLQRRLDPGDLGEIDVAGELPLVQRLKVEVLDLVPIHHHDAGLFRVGGVDQHFLCHVVFRERPRPAAPCGGAGAAFQGGVMRKRATRPLPTGPRSGPDCRDGTRSCALHRGWSPARVACDPARSVRAAGPGGLSRGASACRRMPGVSRTAERSCNAAGVRRIRSGGGCVCTGSGLPPYAWDDCIDKWFFIVQSHGDALDAGGAGQAGAP